VIVASYRNLGDAGALAIIFWANWRIGAWALQWAATRPSRTRILVRLLVAFGCAWMVAGVLLSFHGVVNAIHPDPRLRGIIGGGAYLWMFASTGAYIIHRLRRLAVRFAPAASFDPGRRKLIGAAGNTLVAAPFALAGFGALVERTDFRVREVPIPIPNLPPDLQGLRILQLSDIHLGLFLGESDLARVIDESLNLRPHLALITGDLISMRGDPLDACLRQIARLRADAGILGCMGNHEAYTGAEDYVDEQGARMGIHFLRDQARPLKFGSATLNVAGVDYESISKRKSYLTDAELLTAPGAVNLLMSHNPDVFPVAARKGFDLIVAGHTHGGQVTVEILNQTLNVARFITPLSAAITGSISRPGLHCT
jgi:predicted MPP superfamily phosphohydrolase